MPQMISSRRQSLAAAALVLLVSLALAACGGSSGGSSSTATSKSDANRLPGLSTSTTKRSPSEFKVGSVNIRACLQKYGITLPKPKPGQQPAPGASLPKGLTKGQYEAALKKCAYVPAGGFTNRDAKLSECLRKNGITLPKGVPGQPASVPPLPAGVTRAQYQAALKKCGGGLTGGAFLAGRAGLLKSPALKQALARFASCMRSNGVSVPTPNTSGNGPSVKAKGLNTTSPQFRAAETKCRSDLHGAVRAYPGAAGPP